MHKVFASPLNSCLGFLCLVLFFIKTSHLVQPTFVQFIQFWCFSWKKSGLHCVNGSRVWDKGVPFRTEREVMGVLWSLCWWTGQCRRIPEKGRDPSACWVLQFLSWGLAKKTTFNLCSSPDVPLIYLWVRVCTGAVSARQLIWLGVCLPQYLRLLGSWQVCKS